MKNRKQNGLAAVIALCMTAGSLLCFLSAFPAGEYANALRSPRNGLLLTANAFLRFLTCTTGRIHLLFACTQNRDYLFVAVCLGLLLYAVFYFSARRTILPTLAAGVALACGFGFGLFRSEAGFVLYGIGFLLLLTQRARSDPEWKGFLIRAVSVALCAAVLLAALPARSALQEQLRADGRTRFHRLRYEHGDPLPEGEILRDTAPNKTRESALRVQTEQSGELVLRGFIGERFDGVRWTEIPNARLAEYADLFYWLHRYGFSAAEQTMLALRQAGMDGHVRDVRIEHLGACARFAFLPTVCSAQTLFDPDTLHDGVWIAREPACTAQVPAADKTVLFHAQKTIAAQTDTDYLRCERGYARVVRDTMLDVPQPVQAVFRRQIVARTDAALSDKICFVLDWFSAYTETASPQPFSGDDAVVWFLEQSRSGNDAMFATAAALLLRYLGVPARYAEGYSVAAGTGETIITKRDARVWTEYYLDGVGWIPLETVPGRAQTEKQFYSAYSAAETDVTLRRDEARQPQSLTRTDVTPRRAHSVFLAAVLCAAAVLVLILTVLLVRRLRFRIRMRRIQALPNPEKIAALYRYAQRICAVCGVRMQDAQAARLYEEALFSDHAMTERHVQTMQAFAREAAAACKRADGGLRRIKHILWDCL